MDRRKQAEDTEGTMTVKEAGEKVRELVDRGKEVERREGSNEERE